jgi:hypothetical protein
MGLRTPETCWAVSKRQVVNWRNCCIWLVIYFSSMIMHGLTNFNPLNAELNPTCRLLILLGDLTFMGKCIVSISNKMQRSTVFLYLETALHVSCGTFTHHQERIQLYRQHLVFVTTLLLSAAIVEELEPAWVCCGWIYEYIGILLGVRPILHISRIKVNLIFCWAQSYRADFILNLHEYVWRYQK